MLTQRWTLSYTQPDEIISRSPEILFPLSADCQGAVSLRFYVPWNLSAPTKRSEYKTCQTATWNYGKRIVFTSQSCSPLQFVKCLRWEKLNEVWLFFQQKEESILIFLAWPFWRCSGFWKAKRKDTKNLFPCSFYSRERVNRKDRKKMSVCEKREKGCVRKANTKLVTLNYLGKNLLNPQNHKGCTKSGGKWPVAWVLHAVPLAEDQKKLQSFNIPGILLSLIFFTCSFNVLVNTFQVTRANSLLFKSHYWTFFQIQYEKRNLKGCSRHQCQLVDQMTDQQHTTRIRRVSDLNPRRLAENRRRIRELKRATTAAHWNSFNPVMTASIMVNYFKVGNAFETNRFGLPAL